MALPLKPGYNFCIDRLCKPSDYEMSTLDVYRDYYGISYTVSGNRKFIMPHMIGFLGSGSVGVTPKNIYHKTSYVDNTPYERFVLKFTDKAVAPFIEIIGQEAFDRLYSFPAYNFSPEIQQKIYHIFCDMLYEYEHYSKESDLLMQGMLHNLLATVIRHHLPVNPLNAQLTQPDDMLLKILNFIGHNYMNNPSLPEAAGFVGLSPSHFSRIFKKLMGHTYSEYLNLIKLENARNLLLTTNLSVSGIAAMTGFDNGNYLCSVMKNLMSCTPSDIRKTTI